MEERNIVKFKKDEFAIKEYIKSILGKGKISKVRIEYTPIGEKVIVSTNKPGLVIGRRGEKLLKANLTDTEKIITAVAVIIPFAGAGLLRKGVRTANGTFTILKEALSGLPSAPASAASRLTLKQTMGKRFF